jgi:hypothetical protein
MTCHALFKTTGENIALGFRVEEGKIWIRNIIAASSHGLCSSGIRKVRILKWEVIEKLFL